MGSEAEEIHAVWLHRLANLTLTAYNSRYKNASFIEKRDMENGYKDSGLRMNQKIATKDHFGLEEIQERSSDLIDIAINKIWPMPSTTFTPAKEQFDSCTLDDEDFNLTGRKIIKYSYQDIEIPVSSWIEMFEQILKTLHSEDKSILPSLALGTENLPNFSIYFGNNPNSMLRPLTLDNNIYVDKNSDTETKISILRRLFALFKADPASLVFYLRDEKSEDFKKEYIPS